MIKFKAKDASGEVFNSALSAFTFPAGESHIKREQQRPLEKTEIAILQPTPESLHTDLFHLAMWSNYLSETDNTVRQVAVIPYFPGARADRGAPFGVGVYASFLYGTAVDEVVIFDPHSRVAVDQLNCDPKFFKVTVVRPSELFKASHIVYGFKEKYDGIIAPDKGAEERATAVAGVLGLPVFTVQKTRDFETGKLLGFDTSDIPEEGKFLLVDDICDGGGTFMGIAKATGLSKDQLDLYVSHGIFSGKALSNLPDYFGNVFTTNSYNPKQELLSDRVSWEEAEEYEAALKVYQRRDVVRLLLDKINPPV